MIKAKIGYLFFCPVGKDVTSKREECILRLSSSTRVERKGVKIIDDMKLVMDFLYGAGAKFPCTRYLLPEYKFTLEGFTLNDSNLILSIFEDVGVVEIALNYSVEVDSAERLVYLRQSLAGGNGFCCGKNVSQTVDEVLSVFGGRPECTQVAFIGEINEYDEIGLPEEVIARHPKELYGIMTGDEGFEYVSEELVRDRLSGRWSTRDFVSAIAFRNNFLLLNFDRGTRIKEYRRHQGDFGTEFYGGPNPYFFLDTVNAGVNHGMLFACENGMVAKAISSKILGMHVSREHRSSKLSKEIRRVKEMRHELIITMNRLEEIDLAEMGELDRMIMQGLDIEPLVEKIKYLLELLESELDLLYQNSTNTFVNIITVVGLLVALMEVLQGVLPL